MSLRAPPLPIGVAVWLSIAAACGGEAAQRGGTEANADDGTATAAGEPAIAEDPGVDVFLTEYMIDMPVVIDAGEVRISVTNEGVEDHNLRLLRAGTDEVVWQTDGNVGSGTTVEAIFELPTGRYLAVCDFAGHDTRGMFLEIEARDP
ncbi:MAG: sulfocyanin-like copper-binding protein [Gemmatimonadota bacterium]|nr:sulfocyanin-like copper-binding protein [Gemmatimonadota bacterium]